MKKLIMLLLLIVLLSGCVPTDYYTRTDSPGYNESHWGGLCESCNRTFWFSSAQYNQPQFVKCGYCGHAQDLKMAHNRYNYEVQKADAQAVLKTTQKVSDTMSNYYKQRAENRKEIYKTFLQSQQDTRNRQQQEYYERQQLEELQKINRKLED